MNSQSASAGAIVFKSRLMAGPDYSGLSCEGVRPSV
jgi:hypothetical protein